MSDIKLTYFDIMGRAELLRLLMVAAGQQFEDDRVTFEQWGARKGSAKFNVLPNILLKGKVYGQTMAIAQYLAREYGFYGRNNLDALAIDEVVQSMLDLKTDILLNIFQKDQEKKALKDKEIAEKLQKLLDVLEIIASKDDKGYFVGAKVTLADITFYDTWRIMSKYVSNVESEATYPSLKKVIRCVESIPSIKAYVSSRKSTAF